ncbi:MAG TPA: S1C family serine protease, partial [Steroidobacteraceae bacterium]|nr:S1C family serine protease [Steroidobacteraceae bacterium]
GLLNSETPEAQDGRWKWLRFSAAASPGNSGGPLLDEAGRVLGVVTMKSENENLNYALPIERVLNGSTQAAEFDVRESFGLPLLKNTNVATFKHQFALPTTYADFAKKVQDAHLTYFDEQTRKLLDDNAAVLFPRGDSDKVLASLTVDDLPSMLAQNDQGEWELRGASNVDDAKLPNEGKVQVGSLLETTVFSVRLGGSEPNLAAFIDSKQFMDLLLKGLRVTRMVGLESVRATSLSAAQSDSDLRDRFGRKWKLRIWPLEFVDANLVLLALPTPDGFVGMARYAPAGTAAINARTLKLFADYLHATYSGSLDQWKAFLAAKDLRPEMFDSVALTQDSSGLRFRSARFDLDAPAELLALKSDSPLQVRTAFMKDGERLRLDVAGLFLQEKREGESYVGVFRQPKPGNEAGKALLDRWDHMLKLDEEFDSARGFDRDMHKFWKRTAVSARPIDKDADEAKVMYEVICGREGQLVPREIDEMQERLLRGLRVKER